MDPPFCPPSSSRSWIARVFRINTAVQIPRPQTSTFHIRDPKDPRRVWDTSRFYDPAILKRRVWLSNLPSSFSVDVNQLSPRSPSHPEFGLSPLTLPPTETSSIYTSNRHHQLRTQDNTPVAPAVPSGGEQSVNENELTDMNIFGSATPLRNGSLNSNNQTPNNSKPNDNGYSQPVLSQSTPDPNMMGVSRRSSFGSEMSSTPARKRQISRLERENPDIDPAILAVIDPHKPIREQIAKIQQASKASPTQGSRPSTPAKSDVANSLYNTPSRPFDASRSVLSMGSTMSASQGRRQTSGTLGKGDHPAIEHMKKKAAEDRLNRQRRYSQSRTSYAGSMMSNNDFNASRISNSSYGMSKIGLHSSSGSVLRYGTSARPPAPTSVAGSDTSPQSRFQSLSYVQSILAKRDSSQNSRASTPDVSKSDSPYKSLAAKARGMLVENNKEIQAEKVEKRKREMRLQEMERERERRDARMELLAKLAKEEEEALARQNEELMKASTNRKRDATGTLRYSPEMTVDNSIHPFGALESEKGSLKRSRSPSTTPLSGQVPKRSRSSDPDEESTPSGRPKPTDSKLMPPPPTPTPRIASQTSQTDSEPLFASQRSTQMTPPFLSDDDFSAKSLAEFEKSFSETDNNYVLPTERDLVEDAITASAYPSLRTEHNSEAWDAEIEGHDLLMDIEQETSEFLQSEEPDIGQPIGAFATPNMERVGATPLVRDFAYQPQKSKSPSEGIDEAFEPRPVGPPGTVLHGGSDTDEDEYGEDEEDEEDYDDEDEEAVQDQEAPKEPVFIDLLDSDDEAAGSEEVEEEEEEEDYEEEFDQDEEQEDLEQEIGYDGEEAEEDEVEDEEEQARNDEEEGESEDAEEDGYEDTPYEFYDEAEEAMYNERAVDAAKKIQSLVVEIESSPPPTASIEADKGTQSFGSPKVIPDSFAFISQGNTSETGDQAIAVDSLKNGHIQTDVTAQIDDEPASARSGSQEHHWIRSRDGRLTRSNSPEAVTTNNQQEASGQHASDNGDEDMGDAEYPVDPSLLKADIAEHSSSAT